MEVIREELEFVKSQFGDKRRTEIQAASIEINMEDLITPEDVVVTLSHEGYVKYQPLSDYEAQRRGGRGKAAAKVKMKTLLNSCWWQIRTIPFCASRPWVKCIG